MTAPDKPGRARGFITGTAAVAATYAYFIIFAQFAFLALVRRVSPDTSTMGLVMVAQGLAGIAGSVAAAAAYAPGRLRALLIAGYLVCEIGGLIALAARTVPGLLLAAVAIGAGLGFATVVLASGLRAVTGARHLGLATGLGTGAAYALCILPAVFAAPPDFQIKVALAAVAAGSIAVACLPAVGEAPPPVEPDYGPRGIAVWTVVLLALVWLDSAAFNIIQNTPVLKAATWSGAGRLYSGAGVHLLAGVLAGLAFDRGRIGWVAAGAFVLLAIACLSLGRHDVVLLFYVAGVSIYSAALVFYPARSARPWVVALVYAIAGWGGSALGIGMAQNLNHVPAWFAAAAGVVVICALALRQVQRPL